MFHLISKHLEFRQKYSAARRIFMQPPSRCLDIPMKLCLSCLIFIPMSNESKTKHIEPVQQCQFISKVQLSGSTISYPVLFSVLTVGLKQSNFRVNNVQAKIIQF